METVVWIVHVLAALGVVGLVLMQHGKGADMGAAFGSGASGSLFGSTGSANQRLRARPFYFHYVDVNPKNHEEVWVNELGLWKSTDGGRSSSGVPTPHGDNHGIWFNPDNPD